MINNRDYIQKSFYLDKNILYFNYGCFGLCPKPVLEEKIKFLQQIENNPQMGYSESLFETVIENIKELAVRIGVQYENLALVQNVTQGMCAVLTSIEIENGDEILITNYTYKAVAMETESYFVGKGGRIQEMELKYDLQTSKQIVESYCDFVKAHPKIKFAIIDHIPSKIPMVQPVKQIVKSLHNLGVYVIIDGAHAPGQIADLNVTDIGADVYIGNLHKWYFVPRGTGFLAVNTNCKFQIKPIVVSWLQNYSFIERFLFPGTVDITNSLCIKSAFQFVDSLGGLEVISKHNNTLLTKGIDFLEKAWNVKAVIFAEMAPSMRLIPFPDGFNKHVEKITPMIKNAFERPYYKFTLNKFGFIATAYLLNEKLHFRLCAHVCMEFEHFIKFADKVLQWLDLLERGEILYA